VKLPDLAFSKGDNADACKGHLLEEGGDMFLITTDAIERLGQNNVELALAGSGEQLLVAFPEMARARCAPIRKGCRKRPCARQFDRDLCRSLRPRRDRLRGALLGARIRRGTRKIVFKQRRPLPRSLASVFLAAINDGGCRIRHL